jgi:hypothetical protein
MKRFTYLSDFGCIGAAPWSGANDNQSPGGWCDNRNFARLGLGRSPASRNNQDVFSWIRPMPGKNVEVIGVPGV